MATGTRPAATAVTACVAPSSGTCTSETLAIDANIAIAMCCGLPLPPEAKVILPGFAVAAAMRSAALPKGASFAAIRPHSLVPTSDTGSKSLVTSNGIFACRFGATVSTPSSNAPIV
jgi:hypothetical protein